MLKLENDLLNCEGKLVPAERAIKNRKIIAFFFAASWSPECDKFLSPLKQVYQENLKSKYGMEIIYVSFDETEADFVDHFKSKHSGWYATKFKDPFAEQLRYIYEITTIPQVVVMRISDGALITKTGKEEIEKMGKDVLVAWSS